MLDSARAILSNYIDDVTRYTLYFVDVKRSENPEDLYYLCQVEDALYVVFETDCIVSLSHAAKDISQTFASDHVEPLHWLVKKAYVGKGHLAAMALETSVADKSTYDALVSQLKNSHLRYAVATAKGPQYDQESRYSPIAYGYTRG